MCLDYCQQFRSCITELDGRFAASQWLCEKGGLKHWIMFTEIRWHKVNYLWVHPYCPLWLVVQRTLCCRLTLLN